MFLLFLFKIKITKQDHKNNTKQPLPKFNRVVIGPFYIADQAQWSTFSDGNIEIIGLTSGRGCS